MYCSFCVFWGMAGGAYGDKNGWWGKAAVDGPWEGPRPPGELVAPIHLLWKVICIHGGKKTELKLYPAVTHDLHEMGHKKSNNIIYNT